MNQTRKLFNLFLCLALLLLGYSFSAMGQQTIKDSTLMPELSHGITKKVQIQDIIITGNQKTNKKVIFREIPFQTGDSISTKELPALLKEAHDLIYNTKLFVTVDVQPIQIDENNIRVFVAVKERWYTYPLPYIELSDRSLNEWLYTHHADLRWLSLGMYFIQENFSGNKDRLELKAVLGFNKDFFFEYTAPFINDALTDGLRVSGGLELPRETRYMTGMDNKLLYYRGDIQVGS